MHIANKKKDVIIKDISGDKMSKTTKIKVILLITSLLLLLAFLIYITFIREDHLKSKLKKQNINTRKIMIVAHPDDEMLWGGAHLISDKYLVVCVTCGDDELREKEFEKVMKKVNCPYLSLAYPDRNNWIAYNKSIKKDLKTILKYKKFNYIVTHNPVGEYGHNQHIMVSNYVTDLVKDKSKLYYFNHYYTQEELQKLNYSIKSISKKELAKKEEVLTIYKSQEAIINNHRPTIGYEDFISYNEWH